LQVRGYANVIWGLQLQINPKGLTEKRSNHIRFFIYDYMKPVDEVGIMSDGDYKIRNKKEIHLVTLAVVVPVAIGRVDVFTRKEYRDIIVDSLNSAKKKKDCCCTVGVS